MDRQAALHQRAEDVELSRDEIQRYSRHLLIPEVGLTGQKRLRAARVLVVGAGGLGAPVIQYLSAAGIGSLTIADPDRVDVTNLQRQVLFGQSDLGRLKAEAAGARARELSPGSEVRVLPEKVDLNSAARLVAEHDLVLDATDNFSARYLINDACFLAAVPEVYGSIYQFDGRVAFFWRDHGPCYRCLHPDPPEPESVPGCGEGGVLGALPGLIGSLMALEAMKWITGCGETLLGKLAVFDGKRMKWRETLVHRDKTCALCGDQARISGLGDLGEVMEACAAPPPGLMPQLSPQEVQARCAGKNKRPPLLIDVRQPGEYELGHLPGARLLPLDQLPAHLSEIDQTREVIVYCKDERRTRRAGQLLIDAGFRQVFALEGGIDLWREEIDPTLPRY
jgi:molybdopterin/thiamine biosynthesis adenylyltransferase/rhodanese-related sulfurtransferase